MGKKCFLLVSGLLYCLLAHPHIGGKTIAYDAKIDGVCYKLNKTEMTAEVTFWYNIDEEDGPLPDNDYEGDISIPNSISYMEDTYIVTSIGPSAFEQSPITSITIPGSVTSIGSLAFGSCTNMTDMTLLGSPPENYDAFSYRYYFEFEDQVDIRKNITLHVRDIYIESYKDNKIWKGFKDIVCDERIHDFVLTYYVDSEVYKEYKHKYGDVITPEPEPTKDGYTFSGWKSLPEKMPAKDVVVNGTFAKSRFTLTYKVDGEEYKVYDIDVNTDITPEAFPTKKGMTFSGWKGLPSTMPAKDVTVTGTFSLSQKTIDGVKYQVTDPDNNLAAVIGNNNASDAITMAPTVDFDETFTVVSVSNKVFYRCSTITTIEIPETVTSIGERAFANIDKLTDVTILAANLPETDRTAFENSYIEDYVTLHVPAGSVDMYKAVAPWKNFKSVVAIEGTKEIPAPEIVFEKGEVTFTCEEEGVTFHYEVTPLGQDAGKANKITLGQSYKIKVYASKEGCQDSEMVTKEVYIKKGDLNLDGKVDVADHVELTNIILNAEEEESDKKE